MAWDLNELYGQRDFTVSQINKLNGDLVTLRTKKASLENRNLELSEKSIDLAIKHDDYKNTLKKLNKKAYPLFQAENVDVKIRNDKLYIIMEYTLPLSSNNKKKAFVISSNLMVENGKIKASNVTIDKRYGKIPLDKVVNLVNLLDPLNFTLMELNEQSCKSQVKNVKIEDDIVKIDGIIYVRGE